MPLHRDIHWIGRQWAVTGHGMQLIDQKLKGFFDIETARLWEDTLIENMRAKEWLNVVDFEKGLEVARKRFPADGVTSPPVAPVDPVPSIQPTAPVIEPTAEKPAPAQIAKLAEPPPQAPESIEPAKPVPREFQMQFLGYAKFTRPWRVRMKK